MSEPSCGPATDRSGALPTYESDGRPEVARFLPHGAYSFLDVGCARGGFGGSIRSRYPHRVRIVGIEPVAEQAAQACSLYDEVIVGFYPEALERYKGGGFDCIILNDVLEHMLDPWGALATMASYLNQNGRIVASIPNIQFLPIWLKVLRGHWDYSDAGILDRTHLRFFTRRTMAQLFEGAGYSLESVDGIKFMEGGRKAKFLWPFRRLFGNTAWLQFVLVARLPT